MTSRHWKHHPLLALGMALLLAQTAGAEPRLRASEHPTRWSDAVLRLETPAQRRVDQHRRHFTENCTATLVGSSRRPLLITAWHCIEAQRDLTHPPRVQIGGDWHDTRVLASGGSMLADWAILALESPPTSLPAPLAIGEHGLEVGDRVTAGGFSRDAQLGGGGQELTYHVDCSIKERQHEGLASDCLAFQGASGGPVIREQNGLPRLVGVISAGDSRSLSILVPIERFRRRLLALY